jgi:hypothetical protein
VRPGAHALPAVRPSPLFPPIALTQTMPTYSTFGFNLSSSIHFPEFDPTSADADWRFGRGEPPDRSGEVRIGIEEPSPGQVIELFRTARGVRIQMSRVGVIDLDETERLITWAPGEHDCEGCIRSLMVGRILPIAGHLLGILTLHGSAVVVGDVAIAFLAPKHAGKSTLAQALSRAGAKLASDDCVPILTGAPPMMAPGIARVRLWGDSAERFVDDPGDVCDVHAGKYLLERPGDASVMTTNLPLAAVYLLDPLPAHIRGDGIVRDLLAPPLATLALLQHSKVGGLFELEAEAELFRAAAAVAASAPVFTLQYRRAFDQLDRLTTTLIEWHQARMAVSAES